MRQNKDFFSHTKAEIHAGRSVLQKMLKGTFSGGRKCDSPKQVKRPSCTYVTKYVLLSFFPLWKHTAVKISPCVRSETVLSDGR